MSEVQLAPNAFSFMRAARKFLDCFYSEECTNDYLRPWLVAMTQRGIPDERFEKPVWWLNKAAEKYDDQDWNGHKRFIEGVKLLESAMESYEQEYAKDLEIIYLKHLLEMVVPYFSSRDRERGISPNSRIAFSGTLARAAGVAVDEEELSENDFTLLKQLAEKQHQALREFSQGERPEKALVREIKDLRQRLNLAKKA